MKRLSIYLTGLVALLGIAVSSCTQEYKDKITELKNERRTDSVRAAAHSQYLKDSLSMAFDAIIKEVSDDLETVISNQVSGVLNEELVVGAENATTAKEHLKTRIELIRDIIDGNEQKIDQLATALEKYGAKNAELEESLAISRQQFEETREQLAILENTLAEKAADFDKMFLSLELLQQQNDTLNKTLAHLDKKAFSGFYVVGSFDELEEDGILTKEGGILSIGATPVLKDEFAAEQFRGIDIRETKKIPINSDKYELVTSHPETAYSVFKEDDQVAYLEITDPEEFWKSSKYMVVQVK